VTPNGVPAYKSLWGVLSEWVSIGRHVQNAGDLWGIATVEAPGQHARGCQPCGDEEQARSSITFSVRLAGARDGRQR